MNFSFVYGQIEEEKMSKKKTVFILPLFNSALSLIITLIAFHFIVLQQSIKQQQQLASHERNRKVNLKLNSWLSLCQVIAYLAYNINRMRLKSVHLACRHYSR